MPLHTAAQVLSTGPQENWHNHTLLLLPGQRQLLPGTGWENKGSLEAEVRKGAPHGPGCRNLEVHSGVCQLHSAFWPVSGPSPSALAPTLGFSLL